AHPDGAAGRFGNVVEDASKAEEDRGIVFRPDGKYFFVTSHSNKFLYVYSVNVATDAALNWPPPVAMVKGFDLKAAGEGDADTDNDKFTDMIAGSDGYLYLSIKDKKNVIRFPMYPSSFTSGWTYEKLLTPFAEAVNSSWLSKDGKYIYIIGDNKKVAQYRSNPLSKVGVATFDSEDNFRDIKLSHDSRYLLMTDKKDATNSGGLRGKLISEINFAANSATALAVTRAYPGYKLKSDLTVLSPTGNEILFSHKDKPELYFTNIASLAASVYSTSIPADRILTYDSANKPSAAIMTRVPEYLLVGAGNTAADSTIEYLDLHTFKFDFDRTIDGLRNVPKTIGVSAQGTRFKVGYDTATKSVDAFNMIDSTKISSYSNELSGSGRIVAYAADDETVRYASGIATYSDNFYANLEIPGSTNGYWINSAPGGSFGDSGMDTAWVPQDMKAMPNGGFLILLKKTDGTAMLEWVGKVKWGTDKGKYRRFARWISGGSIPSTIPTTEGRLDASAGNITLLRNATFPAGYKIARVRFRSTFSSSNALSADGNYMTPVIVEIAAGPVLTVRDVGNSIQVTSPNTVYDRPITWSNGGVISANYYVGWWNGNAGTPNTGVVNFGYNVATGAAIADYTGTCSVGSSITNSAGTGRDYEIVFSNELNIFPPFDAQNLAISPDEKFFAIECRGTPNKVYLYDFATNNFGHLTQMNGLIMDYRGIGTVFDAEVPASARFTGGGIKLKETFTDNHAWTYLRTEPFNFKNSNLYATRIFGYFQPNATAAKLALIIEDVARLFIFDSPPNKLLEHWSLTMTEKVSGISTIPSSTGIFMQADHGTDASPDEGLAVMYTTDSTVSTITRPSAGGGIYSTTANWSHITASETRPFNFKPAFLRAYDLNGCNGDSANAMTFSRDLANPILFVLDAGNDDFWALKPGKQITRIDVDNTFTNTCDRQLVVSPDGQKLIFAEEAGSNRIFVNNIGNPDTFAFSGTTVTQSSIPPASFGSLITTVSLNNPPRALGAMPFNSYKSTSRLGKYDLAGKLNAQVYGNNGAALANGAIYVMGGSPTDAAGVATNKI
ncbi:MAG: hypothetical protein ACD_39C00944G0001, partial [uncultured bacterium]